MTKRTTAAYLLVMGLLAWQVNAVQAQDIRKVVDANGVIHYTNGPPEKDRPVRVIKPPEVAPPPASPASDKQSKAPLDPSKALGDWPPKSLQGKPTAVN
jgi:hypothetical protein